MKKKASLKKAKSPCVAFCRMDRVSGLCRGCGRKSDEISNWSKLSARDQKRVFDKIEHRKASGWRPETVAQTSPNRSKGKLAWIEEDDDHDLN